MVSSPTPSPQNWTALQKLAFRFVVVYVLLFITSFSFPHDVLPDIGALLAPFYECLTAFFAGSILHLRAPYTIELISDSTGLYVHALVVAILALILALVWTRLDRRRQAYPRLLYWGMAVLRYYLGIQLLIYGVSKLFKAQFYLPEPNTLYTPLGHLNKDLLFWSTMGSSYGYTVFLGVLETLAALMLFFRRTLLLGTLLSIGIMLNVVALNLCFDISVKLYSFFLLLICLILILPDFRRLIQFFFLQQTVPAPAQWAPSWKNPWQRRVYLAVKTVVLLLIITDSTWHYVQSGNYNDDRAPRPAFHGAYEVECFIRNGDTLPPLLSDSFRWRRAFVHRQGYFIIQGMNDGMADFVMTTDSLTHTWHLTREEEHLQYTFTYEQTEDSLLVLKGAMQADSVAVTLRLLNLQHLPLLQNEFAWTIDP